ncbi:MAG: hypothetical protein ACRDTF_16415 [Pseudonocardiaceae bacterium]
MNRLRKWYGAGPLHLLGLLAFFGLTAYVAAQVVEVGPWPTIALWLIGAAVVHDFVLYPLYSLADTAFRGRPQPPARSRPAVSWRNHLRIPLAFSALLGLLWFPLILRLPEATYTAASGLSTAPYLHRWLLITGILFACSALVYGYRLWRTRSSPVMIPSPSDEPQP